MTADFAFAEKRETGHKGPVVREDTLQTDRVFEGRLFDLDVLEVELETGQRARREIVRHPGAAVVLAQHDDGRFVFVRQFRKPIEDKLLEVVAGTLAAGEAPDACARRELIEETGYAARELTALGMLYPAPGYTDECLHVYFARLEPEQQERRLDDDERIEVVRVTEPEIEAMIVAGDIRDAKTLAAWLLYKAKVDA